MVRLTPPRWTGALLVLALLLLAPTAPAAHEIPADVTVRLLVRPEAHRLRILVRAPLEAMRDLDFPVTGPQGHLDVEAARPLLRDAAELWIAGYLTVYEDGARVGEPSVSAVRVSRPTDRSFVQWESALEHVAAPAAGRPNTIGRPDQALLDVLLDYRVRSPDSDFALEPGLAHLGIRTTTVLRFVPPDGEDRLYRYVGDPGRVRLDPDWHHAALRFVALGFDHILDGLDHLLFLLCLVIPVRRVRPLVAIVTSFTVAHSITLGASALGLAPNALWFPALVETLIAFSIVWMALENVVAAAGPMVGGPGPGRPGAILDRRWMVAFGFGLVHGFGFSFALGESLQFAGSHLVTSLLAFNVGVEIGQLAVIVIMVPALALLYRFVVAERIGIIVLSALVAHTGWHWMTGRGADLLQYDIGPPPLDLFLLADLMGWTVLALIVGGTLRVLSGLYRSLLEVGGRGTEEPAGGGGLAADAPAAAEG